MRYFVGLMVRMAIRHACVFLLFLLCFECIAQKDSLYTDTVIIVQPPLVIKKQVHVSVTDYMREQSSIEIGVSATTSWNLTPSEHTKNGIFYSTSLLMRYGIGQLRMTLSTGFNATSVLYQEQKEDVSYSTVTERYIVDQSCYYIYPNGIKTWECKYQYEEREKEVATVTPYTVEHKGQITYAYLGLTPSYLFEKENWVLVPGFQFSYHRLLSEKNDFWNWEKNLWMVAAECSIGYRFHPRFLTEIKMSYQTNISPLNMSDTDKQSWNLLGGGLGFFYRF